MKAGAVKVLFVAAPLTGHLLPMVPLAQAFRDAGHDVLLASGGAAIGAAPAGMPIEDVASTVSFTRIGVGLLLAHPKLVRLELAGRGGTRMVGHTFGRANAWFLDAVVALVERYRPDLVVHEPLGAAGAVAAARHGVPAVLHETMPFDGPSLVAAVTADPTMRTAMRSHNVAELPDPFAVLSISPPSLGLASTGRPMRYVPPASTGELPEWLGSPGERPRVLVSHSTIAGPAVGDPIRPMLKLAPALDAEVVLVRPPARVAKGALPPNVRCVGWVPLREALPHAAAIVHHSGAGTMFGALAAGKPQLALVGPGDRRHNAELVARRGAGIAASTKELTAATVATLVSDPSIRVAAAEVAAEIAAMPAPAEVAAKLAAELAP
ncbi:glycosyltransferase [Pseudonocardia sp. TRM90224]|uniref:glycosyltransferase n=1 Tax=Pseudonocardia sp. TRM90224 TaxID=2812678 RepID=UPI001E3F9070|nr:glycosyltransferase [Pseudonocardia sp. TRM90224]